MVEAPIAFCRHFVTIFECCLHRWREAQTKKLQGRERGLILELFLEPWTTRISGGS